MLVNEQERTQPSTMSVSRLIEIQEKNFQKQLDWIRQADKKAQILMGTNLAMVGALLSLTTKPTNFSVAYPIVVILGAIFPALSLVSCTSATSPRIGHSMERNILILGRLRVLWRKNEVIPNTEARRSLIFFGQIRALTLDDYSARVGDQTPEQYLEDLNSQCYVNATIADLKHERIRIASSQILLGFIPWALAIYLLRTM